MISIVVKIMFQFTHPGGVRLESKDEIILQQGFNSRTREGCDWDLSQLDK